MADAEFFDSDSSQTHIPKRNAPPRQMNEVIEKINQLQDQCVRVGVNPSNWDLAQIAVIGAQSVGKSSVLENFVRHPIFPRGEDIVTRRPCILHLVQRRTPHTSSDGKEDPIEFAEFRMENTPDKRVAIEDVQAEVHRLTREVAGMNKEISDKPIVLYVYSPHVVTLTVIDLPGLTKVATGAQPDEIEDQIRNIIMPYIQNPNCIILAVSSANDDASNSDALKLAKQVDPDGLRTVVVFTKLDANPTQSVLKVLNGETALRMKFLGLFAVLGRSSNKQKTEKTIEQHLEYEKKFFRDKFPGIVDKQGTQKLGTRYLESMLNRMLYDKIKSTLPILMGAIQNKLKDCDQNIRECGEPVNLENCFDLFLKGIEEFANLYRDAVFAPPELDLNSSQPGSRVNELLFENFMAVIDKMSLDEKFTRDQIRTAFKNALGAKSQIYASHHAVEVLLKPALAELEHPSLRTAKHVHQELINIVEEISKKMEASSKFGRFPRLVNRISNCAVSFLTDRLSACEATIKADIEVEKDFINASHPMLFLAEHLRSYDSPATKAPPMMQQHHVPAVAVDSSGEGSDVESEASDAPAFVTPSIKPRIVKRVHHEIPRDTHQVTELDSDSGFDEIVANRGCEKSMGKGEQFMYDYYALEKKQVTDMVQKKIMFHLIMSSVKQMQGKLQETLAPNGDQAGVKVLFDESTALRNRRDNAVTLLKELEKARDIVAEAKELEV